MSKKYSISYVRSFFEAVLFVLKNGPEMVSRDRVTTLYSRGMFEEMASQLLKSATRSSAPMSLIIADMDDLKKINDSIGHPEGDRLLRISAEIFIDSLRESDIIGRYGGDEFIALLPGTNLVGAEEVVKKLRSALEKNSIKWSFGVAELILSDNTELAGLSKGQLHKKWESVLADLIKEADKLLYQDKLSNKR